MHADGTMSGGGVGGGAGGGGVGLGAGQRRNLSPPRNNLSLNLPPEDDAEGEEGREGGREGGRGGGREGGREGRREGGREGGRERRRLEFFGGLVDASQEHFVPCLDSSPSLPPSLDAERDMLNSETDMEGELLGQLQELHRQLAEVREGGREGG